MRRIRGEIGRTIRSLLGKNQVVFNPPTTTFTEITEDGSQIEQEVEILTQEQSEAVQQFPNQLLEIYGLITNYFLTTETTGKGIEPKLEPQLVNLATKLEIVINSLRLNPREAKAQKDAVSFVTDILMPALRQFQKLYTSEKGRLIIPKEIRDNPSTLELMLEIFQIIERLEKGRPNFKYES
jgi:hypothetical protein